jgi:hypothetical protein
MWDAVVCGGRDKRGSSGVPEQFRSLHTRSRVRGKDESRFPFLSLNNHLTFACNSCYSASHSLKTPSALSRIPSDLPFPHRYRSRAARLRLEMRISTGEREWGPV